MKTTMWSVIVALAVLGFAVTSVAAEQGDGEDVESAAAETEAEETDGSGGEVGLMGAAAAPARTPRVERATPIHAGPHPASTKSIVLGAHMGALVPQLFNELGSWPVFGLELGYILPQDIGPFTRPLQAAVAFGYSAPGAGGAGDNQNLGDQGGSYDWDLQQRMLTMDLLGLWRFMPPGRYLLSAYALAGPRLYLMESVLTAAGEGNDFGENRETKTHLGTVLGGGVDLAIGPGTISGDLKFSISPLNQTITGSTNTGAFSFNVGYRMYL